MRSATTICAPGLEYDPFAPPAAPFGNERPSGTTYHAPAPVSQPASAPAADGRRASADPRSADHADPVARRPRVPGEESVELLRAEVAARDLAEHRAEIVADAAIHGKVSPEVWGEAMADLVTRLRDGRPGEGMAAAVARIGAVLAEHFPRTAGDANELPDRLIVL